MSAPSNSYVDIRQNRDGQDRPYLVGTRVRVQDIVIYHERQGMSVEEIVLALPHLTHSQVFAAMAFFHEDRDAIWRCIRDDEACAESMREKLTGQVSPLSTLKTDVGETQIPS